MVVFAAIVVLCGKLSQPREEATSDDVLSKKGQANAVSSGWRAGNIKGYSTPSVECCPWEEREALLARLT